MQTIAEKAEENLLVTLRDRQILSEHGYCLHVKGGALKAADFTSLPNLVTGWIGEEGGSMFFCHDRDIFIFSPNLSQKIFLQFRERFQESFKYDPITQSRMLAFYDLEINGAGLIELAEAKLEKKRLQKKEEEQKVEIESAAQRRENFLHMHCNQDLVSTLEKRRHARSHLEILVVEDDPFSRKLISTALQPTLSVLFAEDGFAGISTYLHKAPDIVFLDINLPDVNGHDVLAKILSLDPSAYVVMLSGNSQSENVIGAIKAGAKGFVGKPFTKEKLIQYIGKCPKKSLEKPGV